LRGSLSRIESNVGTLGKTIFVFQLLIRLKFSFSMLLHKIFNFFIFFSLKSFKFLPQTVQDLTYQRVRFQSSHLMFHSLTEIYRTHMDWSLHRWIVYVRELLICLNIM
jgi:hypothetical protein